MPLCYRRPIIAELSAALLSLDGALKLINDNEDGFPLAVKRRDELTAQVTELTARADGLKKKCDELEVNRKQLIAECNARSTELTTLKRDYEAERSRIMNILVEKEAPNAQ